MPLRKLFFDANHRLRNGWWIVVFAVLVVISRFAFTPISHGLKALGVSREPLPFLCLLLVTWVCTRLRREPLASVGLRLDHRWLGQAGVGTLIGGGQMLIVAGLVASFAGVGFELNPERSLGALAEGLYMFVFVALFEELLARGFVFQRLRDGAGVWVAQIVLAVLFALGHWGNPGMSGATRVWASIDIAVVALLFGLAYLRTGSLALPVGMHLGWNWTQGHVLGFGVSGTAQIGWWRPSFHGAPEWLSGGAFGPEASVLALLVDLLTLLALWRWTRPAPVPADPPLVPAGVPLVP